MLMNNFFTCGEATLSGDFFCVRLELNVSSKIYDGHFPGLPIAPGVCQVQMVKEVLNKYLEEDFQLVSARDIKFLNFIEPGKLNTLQLDVKLKWKEENLLVVNALMHKDDTNYFKMRSVFKR